MVCSSQTMPCHVCSLCIYAFLLHSTPPYRYVFHFKKCAVHLHPKLDIETRRISMGQTKTQELPNEQTKCDLHRLLDTENRIMRWAFAYKAIGKSFSNDMHAFKVPERQKRIGVVCNHSSTEKKTQEKRNGRTKWD